MWYEDGVSREGELTSRRLGGVDCRAHSGELPRPSVGPSGLLILISLINPTTKPQISSMIHLH